MNLNQDLLCIFKTVIETGSFSATARKLGKVPSSISMSIAQLEDELNLILFDRSKREPQPTDQALSLYNSTLHVLSVMQDWQNHALQLSDQVESCLSIAFATELESLDWTNVFQKLAEIYPFLQLEILTLPQQEALHNVLSGRINFAVLLERYNLNHQEQFIEVGKENLIAVISPKHPLFHHDIQYEELLNHRQIVFNSQESKTSAVMQLAYHNWQTDNQYFAMNIIKAGLAWGFLPQSLIQQEINQKSLVMINIEDFIPNIPLCIDLVWSRNKSQGKIARHLIELVRQQK